MTMDGASDGHDDDDAYYRVRRRRRRRSGIGSSGRRRSSSSSSTPWSSFSALLRLLLAAWYPSFVVRRARSFSTTAGLAVMTSRPLATIADPAAAAVDWGRWHSPPPSPPRRPCGVFASSRPERGGAAIKTTTAVMTTTSGNNNNNEKAAIVGGSSSSSSSAASPFLAAVAAAAEAAAHGEKRTMIQYQQQQQKQEQQPRPRRPPRQKQQQRQQDQRTQHGQQRPQQQRQRNQQQQHGGEERGRWRGGGDDDRSRTASSPSSSSLLSSSASATIRRRVRRLYAEATGHIKGRRHAEAVRILGHIVNDLDPRDAHSYLALGKLIGRDEVRLRGGRRGGGGGGGAADDDDAAVVVVAAAAAAGANGGGGNGNGTSSDAEFGITARQVFRRGTARCPSSVHLWHGWAMHERSMGNSSGARTLLDRALSLDPRNGYVCHAYGLLEMEGESRDDDGHHRANEECGGKGVDDDGGSRDDRFERAERLWSTGLKYQPSAALACSLGRLYETTGRPDDARMVYANVLHRLASERERVEVCLAASSLEEAVYGDVDKASRLLKEAFEDGAGGVRVVADSRAYVALARLGTSTGLVDDAVVKRRLREICTKQIMPSREESTTATTTASAGVGASLAFPVKDGRLFNAWAKLESRANNIKEARRILRLGMSTYPDDHTLLQAAGTVEERLGNVTAARELYRASLLMEPSAPTLIAFGMLELRSPEERCGGDPRGEGVAGPNVAAVRNMFDEALSIDPKHGPAYNAYGNLERGQGNADRARQLYEEGIKANCTDAPSVYHGLAKLHLSMGEVESARSVLEEGLSLFGSSDSRKNENVAFLAHTLSMIELNCNNNPMRAKSVLEQGLHHRRNSPQLLLSMALCESRLGNEKAARGMFERSLNADQGHAQAWQAFGVMEMQAGNFKNAKTLFECGLKNSPRHGALWQSYGEL